MNGEPDGVNASGAKERLSTIARVVILIRDRWKADSESARLCCGRIWNPSYGGFDCRQVVASLEKGDLVVCLGR
jgi:hypothetical protein